MALGAVLAAGGCASPHGWSRTPDRVCEADSPAVVCLEAEPDRPVELRIGGTALIPGECARAPEGGGSVRVELLDRHQDAHVSRFWAPRGKLTTVRVRPGDTEPTVVSRRDCDRSR